MVEEHLFSYSSLMDDQLPFSLNPITLCRCFAALANFTFIEVVVLDTLFSSATIDNIKAHND